MKSIPMFVAALGLSLAASSAYANCNGRGCDTPPPQQGGNTTNQGGAGGHGGTGVGIGIGKGGAGGSVLGSGNSSNLNNNANTNLQGQAQGQAQSSKNSNRNDNRSNASNSNTNANSGNNSDQSVTVQGDNYEARRIPVSTAYAPNIAPTAVCMGSTSGGGSAQMISLSFGTSWTDDNCMLLEQVRTVSAVLGDRETASEMMCDVAVYAAARARVGKPCGNGAKVAQSTTPTTVAASPAPRSNSRYDGTDPIVRKRLGLPPLN